MTSISNAVARDIARRIAALAGSDYRHGRGLAEILGDELGGIVANIERYVLPANPVGALALTEAFLDLDGPLMQFEMDYSSMSRAFEDASLLWLTAAKAVRDAGALPLMDWSARLREIHAREDYGARGPLVEEAR